MISDSLGGCPVETLSELEIRRALYTQLLDQAIPSSRELLQKAINAIDAEIAERFMISDLADFRRQSSNISDGP